MFGASVVKLLETFLMPDSMPKCEAGNNETPARLLLEWVGPPESIPEALIFPDLINPRSPWNPGEAVQRVLRSGLVKRFRDKASADWIAPTRVYGEYRVNPKKSRIHNDTNLVSDN